MAVIWPWFNLLYLLAVTKILAKNRYNINEGGIAKGKETNRIVISLKGRKVIA